LNYNRGNKSGLFYLAIGFLFVLAGILMLVFDIVKVGKHYLTQQQGTIGGTIIIFLGLLTFLIGYFNLSPFSKIREFFEGGRKSKKRK
jgi:hypothetical protein